MSAFQSLNRGRLTVLGLLVALVATVGSLNFSLGMGLVPCRLCWYQRILMYPQVVILGAALTTEVPLRRVALPLSVLGAGIAAYHSVIQIVGGGSCGLFACSTVQYLFAGVATIPNMSLTAFLALGVLEWTIDGEWTMVG